MVLSDDGSVSLEQIKTKSCCCCSCSPFLQQLDSNSWLGKKPFQLCQLANFWVLLIPVEKYAEVYVWWAAELVLRFGQCVDSAENLWAYQSQKIGYLSTTAWVSVDCWRAMLATAGCSDIDGQTYNTLSLSADSFPIGNHKIDLQHEIFSIVVLENSELLCCLVWKTCALDGFTTGGGVSWSKVALSSMVVVGPESMISVKNWVPIFTG